MMGFWIGIAIRFRAPLVRLSVLLAFVVLNFAVTEQAVAYKPDMAANMEIVSQCVSQSSSPRKKPCLGMIVDHCITESGNPAVIPRHCWVAENAAWESLLDKTFQRVLEEIGSDKPASENALREAHKQWIKLRDLDCRVEEISSPRTHGVIRSICVAEATAKRFDFMSGLLGSDWTDY